MIEIDRERLERDLERLTDECTAFKRALRARWTLPMADTQRALVRARRRLTEIHVFRAHLRGKYHVLGPPRDGWSPGSAWDVAAYHVRVAGRVANEYALPASAAVAP
jgi:hypothetical protein